MSERYIIFNISGVGWTVNDTNATNDKVGRSIAQYKFMRDAQDHANRLNEADNRWTMPDGWHVTVTFKDDTQTDFHIRALFELPNAVWENGNAGWGPDIKTITLKDRND